MSDAERLRAAEHELADFAERAEVFTLLGGPTGFRNTLAGGFCELVFILEWVFYGTTHHAILLPAGRWLAWFVLVLGGAWGVAWLFGAWTVWWVNRRIRRAADLVVELRGR